MPRTKVVKKNAKRESEEKELKLRLVLQHIQNKKKEYLLKLKEEKNKAVFSLQAFKNEEKCFIPYKYHNMTISEITDAESFETTGSVNCISKENLLNITKSVKKDRKNVKRSASFVDDEAESVHSGGHKSRGKARVTQSTRKTRSLSRTNTLKPSATTSYKTPMNKVTPPNTYGVVTPKCKPNTPQILLRRPKNGEVALSMQGSPLYTASVVTENMANINIPLLDGRLLTLQPQRGLRVSQIPQFDPETLRQLETLRENLSKVCAATSVRCNDI
ncbi:uncharacterized protein LOC108915323 isoform X2 [Anoplophora glabripennis]|uniref:uncharacterized protein LOC108915323 isoform X2 n=1 Tax=Anoplophora glabripennis TaxID=217634 RepID=UPI000875282F|nr:uncharacterized protein LOC108915323 isoform X2 [Anoplophora glabripennis]